MHDRWVRKCVTMGILESLKIPFLLWVSFFIILLLENKLFVQLHKERREYHTCSEGHGRVHHTVTCHTWFPRTLMSPLVLKWSVSPEKYWFSLRNRTSVLELPLYTKQYCFASAEVMIWFFETSDVQIEVSRSLESVLIVFWLSSSHLWTSFSITNCKSECGH